MIISVLEVYANFVIKDAPTVNFLRYSIKPLTTSLPTSTIRSSFKCFLGIIL